MHTYKCFISEILISEVLSLPPDLLFHLGLCHHDNIHPPLLVSILVIV